MSKVSDYVEATESVTPNGGWLFIAELQDDGSYITKKIAPHNVGAVGPVGPQGTQGNPGVDGAQGVQGVKGDKGDKGDTGNTGATGAAGSNGVDAQVTRASTTSVAVGTGSKSFTYTVVATNLGWLVGTRLRAISAGTPDNYMEGLVTTVSNSAVTINVDLIHGSGSSADWNIGLIGEPGPTLVELSSPEGEAWDFMDYGTGAITSVDKGVGWNSTAGRGINATVVSRTTHNSVTQKRISLANNASLVRKFPWGGDWGHIRMGFLARINGSATFTSNGKLAIGLCSGTTNPFDLTAATDNFLGMVVGFDGGTDDDWTLTTGTMSNHLLSGAWEPVIRRGTTSTGIGGSFTTTCPAFASTEAYTSLFMMDIIRPVRATTATSVLYDMLTWVKRSADGQSEPRQNLLMTMRGSPNPGSLASTALTAGGSFQKTQDESTGAFDCLNIFWENTSNPLEISAYSVMKIY